MDKRIKILGCFLLIIFGGQVGYAQTIQEQEFSKTVDALFEQLDEQKECKNYQACEAICQKVIDLYDTQKAQLSEGYSYFKYAGYYNQACCQALQGKKQEAVNSLLKALADGKLEISYKQLQNDSDLAGILEAEELKDVLAKLRETTDYLYILQKAPAYVRLQVMDSLPQIRYAPATDPDLMRVKQYFQLDSVVKQTKNEVDLIKCILTYIHNKIRHDGQNGNPINGANSINYAEACKDGSRGLNCRGLATVLNECYLSMGIPSRVVTCMPKTYISDCHVINAVYSETLGKWLWIDPTNNAWVTDGQGNMLSVQEVRERLREGLPVQVNEEANWNNEQQVTTEDYLYDYMAKNLYYLECWTDYGFGTETGGRKNLNYIFLQPAGCDSSQRQARNISVNDDNYFWQAPFSRFPAGI